MSDSNNNNITETFLIIFNHSFTLICYITFSPEEQILNPKKSSFLMVNSNKCAVQLKQIDCHIIKLKFFVICSASCCCIRQRCTLWNLRWWLSVNIPYKSGHESRSMGEICQTRKRLFKFRSHHPLSNSQKTQQHSQALMPV